MTLDTYKTYDLTDWLTENWRLITFCLVAITLGVIWLYGCNYELSRLHHHYRWAPKQGVFQIWAIRGLTLPGIILVAFGTIFPVVSVRDDLRWRNRRMT